MDDGGLTMEKRVHRQIRAILTTTCALATRAQASVVEFTSFTDWEQAAGLYTSIGFDEVPPNTFLSDQYADLGINFPDGNDVAICCSFETFPFDGAGVDCNPDTLVEFAQPMNAIGMQHLGIAQIQLFLDRTMVYESRTFIDFGNPGEFAGIISEQPFDSALLLDPIASPLFFDNLHFGPPIPAPAALSLLALAGLRRSRLRHHRRG
jgi:hypothetical protein